MNKLPMSTALLSVIVAVALWYVATLLEGDVAVQDNGAGSGVPSFGRESTDSPLRGGADALRCQESEQRLQALVEDSRYCETDDDCTIFDYGYPIQCLMSVAKSDITRLRLEYRDYQDSCAYRVYYDCPSEPLEREAVCREHRCEVELSGHDDLRDQTLQHLGIDDVGR